LLAAKADYRKRNLEHIKQYNRAYRSQAAGKYAPTIATRRKVLEAMPMCQRCGTERDLQLAHKKPHWAGGTNEPNNFLVFCRQCHHDFDEAFRPFWAEVVVPVEWGVDDAAA
jgi:5-methylcytosine-specific restriction endonuclease McrA